MGSEKKDKAEEGSVSAEVGVLVERG